MLLTEENYVCELSKSSQEVAQNELNETNKLRKKALADVRKWIKNQPHLRRTRTDANFILRFLRMQKFDIKESCEILEKYLTMRVQYPAWFQNLDCRVNLYNLSPRDINNWRTIFKTIFLILWAIQNQETSNMGLISASNYLDPWFLYLIDTFIFTWKVKF